MPTPRRPLTAPQAWGRYYDDLTRRRCRPATTTQYRVVLHDFFAHLGRAGRAWHAARPADLDRYLDRRRPGGGRLSDNTRAKYGRVVACFYAYAYHARLTRTDRMAGYVPERIPEPRPRAVDLDDVRRLLDYAMTDERLEVIGWLAYGAGLRVGEIARARVEDVVVRGPYPHVRVRGKGGRARTVPLPGPAVEVLRGYLARRPGTGPLVASLVTPGAPISPDRVTRLLSRVMHALGIDETGHGLRHAYATELLRAGRGRNLLAVSRLLGHATTRVTETVYTSSYDGDAAETVALLPDPRRPR